MFQRNPRIKSKTDKTCNGALTSMVTAFETTSAIILRRTTNIGQKNCDDDDVDNDDFGFRSSTKVVAIKSPAQTPPMAAPIDMLPDEILLYIFSYLPLLDTARAVYVCRRWYDILKSSTSPWRYKRYFTMLNSSTAELLQIACVLPQLSCLHMGHGYESAVHIAWPTAAIYLKLEDGKKPTVKFDTKNLVLARKQYPAALNWVVKRTLKAMYIGNDCTPPRNDGHGPYRMPECKPERFCALCTYDQHTDNPRSVCPMKMVAEWCDMDICVSSCNPFYRRRTLPAPKGIKVMHVHRYVSLKQYLTCAGQ